MRIRISKVDRVICSKKIPYTEIRDASHAIDSIDKRKRGAHYMYTCNVCGYIHISTSKGK